MFDVGAKAADKERGDEGLCALCHHLVVQILKEGDLKLKIGKMNVRFIHTSHRDKASSSPIVSAYSQLDTTHFVVLMR